MKGSPGWHREDRETPFAEGYEAEAAEIEAEYAMKMAGLRRRLPPAEIAAAMRALQEEKQGALRALRSKSKALQSSRAVAPDRQPT